MVQSITATTPTKLRSNLYSILEDITENSKEVIITMKSGKNAVLLSEDEVNRYRALEKEQEIAEQQRYDEELKRLESELRQATAAYKAGKFIPWDEAMKDLDDHFSQMVAEPQAEYKVHAED